tara:strand:- start:8 stop:514 length:507 start_codon:yes stop_codon:yes gene_type:complete
MPLTEEEKKERNREACKRYREKNKEYHKEYREKNKEKKKYYNKQYREKNKEKIKEYIEKNKERTKEYDKQYREKNKEKIKEYRQTPEAKKAKRIKHWEQQGIVPPCSWDEFHDEWEKATNCEDCDVVMTVGERYNTSTTKCPDHDHSITDGSPNFRGFVCHGCNTRRG